MKDGMPDLFLDDGDVRIYQGDVREVLKGLPAESVHCVVTSPPYWGLRDYGTGSWEGGDAECDHVKVAPPKPAERYTEGGPYVFDPDGRQFESVCGKCGASRVDNQLGLEATPDLYVANMVEVFREVRRVLRADGTCWVNMGDSYASGEVGRVDAPTKNVLLSQTQKPRAERRIQQRTGLKPKDLCMIPARLALALQADGWWLRSQIVWSKPNPMPESVTDRPTTSHEFVFLLAKSPRYFYDANAVSDVAIHAGKTVTLGEKSLARRQLAGTGIEPWGNSAKDAIEVAPRRNLRSVWEIPTQPYPEAHFATYPEELVRRCILAGCPEGGWVLDPFMGSGTTALVARKHGRNAIGVELNPDYNALAARRLQQLSLLAVQA